MFTCTASEIVVPIVDTNSALLSARDASARENVSPIPSTFMSSVIWRVQLIMSENARSMDNEPPIWTVSSPEFSSAPINTSRMFSVSATSSPSLKLMICPRSRSRSVV